MIMQTDSSTRDPGMPARNPRRHSKRRKVATALVSLALAWLAGEQTLRWLGLPADERVFYINKETENWDCYCSNPRNYFVERKSADGKSTIYCVDHSHDAPRVRALFTPENANAFKIVAVGDSFTWGLGVKAADNYPSLIGQFLQDRAGRPVAVSNHAQVGRMIAEIQVEMAQALAAGVPDLCVYGFVLNDPIDERDVREGFLGPTDKAAGMDNPDIDDGINIRTANLRKFRLESTGGWLRNHSRIADMAFRQWEWRQIQQHCLREYLELYDPAKNSKGLEATWEMLQAMHQLQAQAGKRFLVVIFPLFVDTDGNYPFAGIHQQLADGLRQRGIEFLDLLPAYRNYRCRDLWVHDVDRHPNELAHRVAAEAIVQHLLDTGIKGR